MMKKKIWILLLVFVGVLSFSGLASAAPLQVIGTANYLGNDYNLIYEEAQQLVWLDYTKGRELWSDAVNWAANLGEQLTLNINPNFNVFWTNNNWRLPIGGSSLGYYQTSTEMGHLYYISLENPAEGPFLNRGDFQKLHGIWYWASYPRGCGFTFSTGYQGFFYSGSTTPHALAVRSGKVFAVPDHFGTTLQTAPNYDFFVEQDAQTTESIYLYNPGNEERTATLEILNPHPELTIWLESQEVNVAPGTTKNVSVFIEASFPIEIYDGLLLKLTVDNGETLYSNIKIYVTETGAEDLPDLVVSAGDINVIRTELDDQITYVATIHNIGNSPADNVIVQFYDFGVLLGEDVLPVVPAKGKTSASITVPAPPTGDRLIDIVIDPLGTIPELDKDNNEASQVIPQKDSAGAGYIQVTGNLPSRVCANSLFSVGGHAAYDIAGNTVYPVKGGSVQITTAWPTLYGDLYTNISGNFTRFLFAPESPGSHSVSMTVTDYTFSGTGQFAFDVVECPPYSPLPWPELPPGVSEPIDFWELINAIIGLYEYICSGDNCPPVPERDVYVYSKDIFFTNNRPDPNEEITIGADIHYWDRRTDYSSGEVQVNFYVIAPDSPRINLPPKIVDSIGAGSSKRVFNNWKASTNGIHIIEVEAVPTELTENIFNNAATRAIIVGPYASGQGAISGQVRDLSGGLGDILVRIIYGNGTIGSTFTDDTGFYLIENVPMGDYQVQLFDYGEFTTANVEDQLMSTVDFILNIAEDTTPPVITPTITGTLGNDGWYTSDVTVSWSVVDDESSITIQIGCETTTVSTDTTGITLYCSATSDGGTSSESITIKRDATPPTITGNVSPEANANGWHNSAVPVTFTCNDATSGIATCAMQQILEEGKNQSVDGTAIDNAGNSAITQVTGINVDYTPPEVSVTGVENGKTYIIGLVPAAGCKTTDELSGVQTDATLSVTGGNLNGVGTFTASCIGASDKAGNWNETSLTYQVIYPFTGFFMPVENPPVLNVMRANAAVPFKFSLGGDQGLDILMGSPTSQTIFCEGGGIINEIEETVTAGNSSLNYDPITDDYIYIWKTDKKLVGTCQQFTLLLNDGTTHKAYFQFK